MIGAVKCGDEVLVAQLLAHDPQSPNETDEQGLNALHYAAQVGHEGIVAQLLAHSPNLVKVVTLNQHRKTALHYAAEAGHERTVAQLLDHSPNLAKKGDIYDMPPLHHAALAGQERIVEQLLARGPSLLKVTYRGRRNALHFAAQGGNERVVAQLLAREPALIDSVDSGLFTALHHAVSHDQLAVVSQLLAYKPSLIDAVNKLGEPALFIAAQRGNEDLVKLLLKRKPGHVFCVDKQKNTLLHYVLGSPFSEELTKSVWGMNPEALRAFNRSGVPAFHRMMDGYHINKAALEWLKWKLTLEEILGAFEALEEGDRFSLTPRSVVEQPCQPLLETLHQDIVEIVYDFLGLGRSAKVSLKRKGLTRES